MDDQEIRRFSLALPVELTQVGSRRVSDRLTTQAVSGKEVLINCPAYTLDIGTHLEYYVTLPTAPSGDVIRLHCLGRVLCHMPGNMTFMASIEQCDFISDPTRDRAPRPPKADSPRKPRSATNAA